MTLLERKRRPQSESLLVAQVKEACVKYRGVILPAAASLLLILSIIVFCVIFFNSAFYKCQHGEQDQ